MRKETLYTSIQRRFSQSEKEKERKGNRNNT